MKKLIEIIKKHYPKALFLVGGVIAGIGIGYNLMTKEPEIIYRDPIEKQIQEINELRKNIDNPEYPMDLTSKEAQEDIKRGWEIFKNYKKTYNNQEKK